MRLGRKALSKHELIIEIETLEARLAESEEVLRAIRSGEVDALVVASGGSERIFSVEGVESAYRGLVEAMNEGAAILQDSGKLLYCNGRLAKMLKIPVEKVMSQPLTQFIAPSDLTTFQRLVDEGPVKACTGEATFSCLDGSLVPVQLSISPMKMAESIGMCLVATELTDIKQVEEQLRQLSFRDELTGLLNRRGLFAFAEQSFKLVRRVGGVLLLFYADLNCLKQINDNLGHAAGDRALVETAHILRNSFRESDILARVGGDEFAVVAMSSPDAGTEILRHRLQDQIAAHNDRSGLPYKISMSIGSVSIESENLAGLDRALDLADREMYRQKQCRRMLDRSDIWRR